MGMVILETSAAFFGAVAFLAVVSKGLAFHSAMYAAIAFKGESERIYSRMPSVLDWRWLILACVTAALFSSALLTHKDTLLVLTLIGAGVTIGYSGVRSHRFVKLAAREVGLPWPTERR